MSETTLQGPTIEARRSALTGRGDLVDVFDDLIASPDDETLVRINPVRFAREHGRSIADVVDLFLHARKLGLMTMEWQYVCPGCGEMPS
jgi:hypothetical protein